MATNRSYFMLLVFVALVSVVAISGVQFQPGEWYSHLEKPFWTPPNWLFPPVWSALYLMIAIAGWLIFLSDNSSLKILWVFQLILNGLWSWLFFGNHYKGLGLVDILAMLACISTMVILSRKISKFLCWLMVPYLTWVSYASSLNAAIYVLNRG